MWNAIKIRYRIKDMAQYMCNGGGKSGKDIYSA